MYVYGDIGYAPKNLFPMIYLLGINFVHEGKFEFGNVFGKCLMLLTDIYELDQLADLSYVSWCAICENGPA